MNIKTDDDIDLSDIRVAGKTIRVRPASVEWYYYDDYSYLIDVSHTAEEGSLELTFEDGGHFELSDLRLIRNTTEDFGEKYQDLKKYALQDTVAEGNAVSGSTNFSDERWLFMALPYSRGWTCTIDGEKAEIIRADYSFMAVQVPAGEHEIRFTYCTPGLKAGGVLSLISLLFLLAVGCREKRKVKQLPVRKD